jgi:hypothetical protein
MCEPAARICSSARPRGNRSSKPAPASRCHRARSAAKVNDLARNVALAESGGSSRLQALHRSTTYLVRAFRVRRLQAENSEKNIVQSSSRNVLTLLRVRELRRVFVHVNPGGH